MSATSTSPGPALRVSLPGIQPSVKDFLTNEAGSAVYLLAATIVALIWANSPWADAYEAFWHTTAGFHIGTWGIELDLHGWVNDAAMAIFFAVVGLEISREATTGDLRDKRTVAVPALGALGGLLVPVLIYLAFNGGTDAAHGWGVVMSTDTAFLVGILALFGPKCPDRLRLFLLTLAIVDDIGAITVMSIFYTSDIDGMALALSGAIVLGILAMRWLKVWQLAPYVIAGIALWFAVQASGVHATLAGVIIGLLIPARPAEREDVEAVAGYGRDLIDAPTADREHLAELAARAAVPTNDRLQRLLHPWSAFVVVPLFGLANAGIVLNADDDRDRRPLAPGHRRRRRPGARERDRHHGRLDDRPAVRPRRAAGPRPLGSSAGRCRAGRHRVHHLAVHRRARVRRPRDAGRREDRHPGRARSPPP